MEVEIQEIEEEIMEEGGLSNDEYNSTHYYL